MKTLIAEDNPGFRQVLERMLKKWGYEVVVAESGLQALDWMMPGLDGLEVCRRVRELAREPYVYILLLTAKDAPKNWWRAWRLTPTIT